MSNIQPFFSQHGEDARLAYIFRSKTVGTCLEVGAFDGVTDSTTLHFEKRGWNCILVEAHPGLADKARANRKAVVFACAAGENHGTADFLMVKGAEYLSTIDIGLSRHLHDSNFQIDKVAVPVMRVDEILQAAKINSLDFVTIDVEGAELSVLRGFDLQRWKPRVVVVEDLSEGQDNSVRLYLESKGYRCFLSENPNDWYASKDDVELVTFPAKIAQTWRRIRKKLGRFAYRLLPISARPTLVRWKRRLLGKI